MAKIIWIVAALLLVMVLAAVLFVWRRPLTVFNWMNRRTLVKAGFVKQQVNTPAGVQAIFEAGEGPTLVLLHGAGDQAGTWANVAPSLTAKYHVIVPDLAGHGESAPHSGPLSIGTVLEGLEGVLAAKSPQRAILVGNSLGAWLAMLYARKHPDRVDRLVLINGGALMGDRPDLTLTPENREQARLLFDNITDPGSLRVPDYVLDDVAREAQRGPLKRMSATAAEMPQYLLDGKLQEIQAPTDLLWGESDKLVSLDYAKRLQAGLPAARLTTIPRCGHVPQQECPKVFAAALMSVLKAPAPTPKAATISKEAGK
jgi:pimeloyl-ACP methyl ester carboxylesterase